LPVAGNAHEVNSTISFSVLVIDSLSKPLQHRKSQGKVTEFSIPFQFALSSPCAAL
jgi:hypothetical protein